MLIFHTSSDHCTPFTQRLSAFRVSSPLRVKSWLSWSIMAGAFFIGWPTVGLAEESGELKELPRAVLKHAPPVYKEWTFENLDPETFPPGFHTETLGTGRPGEWTLITKDDAPSRTHVLRQSAACSSENCYPGIRTKYIDLTVQILSDLGTPTSGAGLIFNAQNKKDFLAVLVYPATNTVKAIEFIDGVPAVLKEEPVVPQKRTRWHFLRVHLSSIVSREVVEVSFDNQFIMSLEPQELKVGHLGLITTGDGAFAFDNLRAVELHTGNPISRPPAY